MTKKSPSSQSNSHNNISSFQFSESNFREYLVEERDSLQLEKVYTAPKYEGIDEDSSIQRKMTKALFRSTIYPEITAESEIDIEKHIKDSNNPFSKKKTQEDIQNEISDRLASSGNSALTKKEMGYKAAIVKQGLKETKKQWLQDNNIAIKDVTVNRSRGENYVYHVTLSNKYSSGTDHGNTAKEALEKAFIELQRNEKSYKNWIAELRKKEPEFMYVRTEYEDTIQGLGYHIRNRKKNEPNDYIVELVEQGTFSNDIRVVGSSRQEAFEEVIKEAEVASKRKGEKKGFLDITHLSMKSIFNVLENVDDPDTMHEVYTTSINNEIASQLESGGEVTFSKEQLEEYKQYCIDTEQYEMAVKVVNYLKTLE